MRVDRQSLVFIVLDIDLLTDEVERWQSSGVAALLKLKIVSEAHLLLIAAKEQYIGDPSVSLLKRDSRPMQLFRYATQRRESRLATLNLDQNPPRHLNGILQRKYEILVLMQLYNILKKNLFVFL